MKRKLIAYKDTPDNLLSVVHSLDVSLDYKQAQILASHRPQLFVEGSIADVKLGNYPVYSKYAIGIDNRQPELYDHDQRGQNLQHIIYRGSMIPNGGLHSIYWTNGLNQNIALQLGNTKVLVMDNHHYALLFLLANREYLGSDAAMLHIDAHHDFYYQLSGQPTFRLQTYDAQPDDIARSQYLYSTTEVGTWLAAPLVDTGLLSKEAWRWLCLNPGCDDYYVYKKDEGDMFLSSQLNPDGYAIVDLDIDYLLPIDSGLSGKQKAAVLNGDIPESIRKSLDYVADLSKNAKLLTVATSPGFINQARAVVYVKYLLECLSKAN